MTKPTTSARFTSFAALGEALNPAARNDTPDCSAQDDSAEHDQSATDAADDAAASHAEATATTNFQDAFGDVGALSIVELGGERQELDMPEPIEAQHDCAAIMATLFDLFRDTRLEASAQAIAWGFVNSFHYEAQKLEREEDRLCAELSDMTRRMDPSEIFAVEMEELQLRAQTKTEQRAAIECMRDYAADCYRAQSGHPWSPARGSKVSSGGTASQIAAIDFLKARATDHREKRNPTGPLVVFSGGQEWHDWQQLWAKLDQIKARVPHMTLCTTAQRKRARNHHRTGPHRRSGADDSRGTPHAGVRLEARAAPGSLASVRPFGLPLLRLGRGSAGAGIEPAPALLPRGETLSQVVPVCRPGRRASRTAGPHHFASQNRDPHRR